MGHRVLTCSKERYSAPYFYNPSYGTTIAPVPSMVTAEEPARFWPMEWGYFRAMRVMGNYGDFGEYVKADMWRVEAGAEGKPRHVGRQERFVSTVDYGAAF